MADCAGVAPKVVELLALVAVVHTRRQEVVESVVLVAGTAYIGMVASDAGTGLVVEFVSHVVIGIVAFD